MINIYKKGVIEHTVNYIKITFKKRKESSKICSILDTNCKLWSLTIAIPIVK